MTPGLHRIDAATYHADPAPRPSLSSTVARLLLDHSPLHAWTAHPRLNPEYEPQEKKTFDIGRAAHRAVLGAGDEYVAYPEEMLASNGAASTKAAKEWAEEARAAGLTPLKADEVDTIGRIADAVRRKLDLMKMEIDPNLSELAALAEIGGCWCRALIDNAPAGKPYLIDMKTTTDASPDGCVRAVAGYGYDVQVAHYLATWKAATGEDRTLRLVMVEKDPPYECSVVELYASPGDEADWMTDAHAKVGYARDVWRDCLEANRWPGYPARVALIGAPGWHRQKWEAHPGVDRPSPQVLAAARAAQAPEGVTT